MKAWKSWNRPTRRSVLIALVLSLAFMLSAAAQHTHDAAHGELMLDDGRKWPTDAPLRQGMTAIRDAVATALPAPVADGESASEYRKLAAGIDEQLHSIVRNCKLAPEADAQLHLVLAELMRGSELMKSDIADQRDRGAAQVIHALAAYGQHFEHTGWRPIE